MRISTKGQVTIPAELRAQLGLKAGTEVDVQVDKGRILISPRRRKSRTSFDTWLERARGAARGGLSTDEVMRLTRGDD